LTNSGSKFDKLFFWRAYLEEFSKIRIHEITITAVFSFCHRTAVTLSGLILALIGQNPIFGGGLMR